MSQHPSPYSLPGQYPAGYGHDPFAQYLAPARRAGLMMIILGALLTAYALCNGIGSLLLPTEKLMEQNRMFTGDLEAPRISAETLRVLGVVFSGVAAATGFAMIVFGVFVRRNSGGSIVAGIVLTSLIVLFLGLLALFAALGGIVAPVLFVFSCILVLPVGLFVLQLFWLAQAARAGSAVRSAQMQYQAQYWQYQQQQQLYGYPPQQGGHGYGAAPPGQPAAQPLNGDSHGPAGQQ